MNAWYNDALIWYEESFYCKKCKAKFYSVKVQDDRGWRIVEEKRCRHLRSGFNVKITKVLNTYVLYVFDEIEV
jgi:hypothetical protein